MFVSRWFSLAVYPARNSKLLVLFLPRLDRSWAVRFAVEQPSYTGAGTWAW